MTILSFLKGLFDKLPDKHPKDYTLTKSSTKWEMDAYHCSNCQCLNST